MFKASITYTKSDGLQFSNPEGTFTRLFDEEKLYELLSAFDQDRIEIRGQMLPEDPIRFAVDGIRFGDFDFALPVVENLLRYLRPGLIPRKFIDVQEAQYEAS